MAHPLPTTRRLALASVLLVAMLAATQSAQAAPLTWDPTLVPATPAGGAGTWDLSTANWSNGATDAAWTDTTGTVDTATFGGTAGTVTLGSSLGALGLIFNTTDYTVATGSNTLTLGSSGIDASALSSGTTTISGLVALGAGQSWNVGSGATLTASAAVSGSGTLTKTGSGTLVLSGANTFSGTTAISTGTLQLANASALASSTLTLAAGTTLQLRADSNTVFTPGLSGSSNTTVTASANNTSLAINVDQLTGTGSGNLLTVGGTTVFNVGTSSNFTVNVTGGNSDTLRLNAVELSGGGSNTQTFNVASGNNLQIGTITAGGGTFTNNVNCTVSFTGAGNTVVDGAIIQSTPNRGIGLNFSQTGTVTLSGTGSNLRPTNTSGTDKGVVINSGATVNFNGSAVINSSQSVTFTINGGTIDNTSGGSITLSGNHPMVLSGDFTFGGTNALNMGTSTVNLGTVAGATRTITTNGTGALTFGGIISNGTNVTTPTINLTKSGSGTLTLSGGNTFNGTTTISAGTLALTGTGAINSNSGISVATGATFSNNGTVAVTPALTLAEGSALAGTGSFTPGSTAMTANLADGFAAITAVTGLTKAGTLTFSLTNITAGSYSLFSGGTPTGSFTGVSIASTALGTSDGNATFTGTDGTWNYSFTNLSNNLTISAIPEPSTYAALLGMVALAGACLYRRRRKA